MRPSVLASILFACLACSAAAQPYGPPDRGSPGDEPIQRDLAHRAALDALFRFDTGREPDAPAQPESASPFLGIRTADDWIARRDHLRSEYLYMLGLDPLPERTDLHATVTGTFEGDGFVVEKLHYQSVPGLYVIANLYRPTSITPGERLPAIFYPCGHSPMGRNGNKTAYQSHGIWFARHGYICLVVDSLQLGEIPGVHHGTYREGRWWWHSRGYTPGGVECWNGIRGLDYLTSRPDVDPERLGVTGISGGGAATFWIAAADDRVKAAAPVSGMADLESYVGNRVINGHCDCMFLYNTFRWPWTGIAGLIAPRPLLFVNSDADSIFPMDANERVIARLERLYSLFGASDRVEAVVSVGGHAYRDDILRSVYEFMNRHLKNDASPVTDASVDAVAEDKTTRHYPIDPEKLRVFPTDSDLPTDSLNGQIDRHFVPVARLQPPVPADLPAWRDRLVAELKRVSFGPLSDPANAPVRLDSPGPIRFRGGPALTLELTPIQQPQGQPTRVVLVVAESSDAAGPPDLRPGDLAYRLIPRGFGPTRWTTTDPPNYVARAHALVGLTVDTARVLDVINAATILSGSEADGLPLAVAGSGRSGLLGAYAALLSDAIDEAIVLDPPSSHMDTDAPQFLNVLRVLDIPDALGFLAPKPLTLAGADQPIRLHVADHYRAAGVPEKLQARD